MLQVKHYEISQKNKGTNEFELGNRRVMIRDNECQVNIDNILYER